MADIQFNSKSAEILAKWYLRLNGYFIVDNFIVHAGDDDGRISNGIVGNHTETDLLAVRFKFNQEITGGMRIQRDEAIIDQTGAFIDFVIAEVKTGKTNKLNRPWREKRIPVVEYILRYAGFIDDEELTDIAIKLADEGSYYDEKKDFAVRLVLISQSEANQNWQRITNILFEENIIDFFVKVWGPCWADKGIGSASKHDQWDDLIKDIFNIVNDQSIDVECKKQVIKRLLQ